jgi:hypothetical protein
MPPCLPLLSPWESGRSDSTGPGAIMEAGCISDGGANDYNTEASGKGAGWA